MTQFRTIEIDVRLHRFIEAHRLNFHESQCEILCRVLKLDATPSVALTNGAPQSDGKAWTRKGVTLAHGTKAQMDYNGVPHTAEIRDGAWVTENDKFTVSPSAAARAVARTRAGKKPSLDGWKYWRVLRPGDHSWIALDQLRRDEKPTPPVRLEEL